MTTTLHASSEDLPQERRGAPLRRWLWRLVLLLGLALVLYVVLTFVQVWLASRSDAAQSADAIVVLGAAQYDCEPSPVLEQRLDHAHRLYEDGVADTIVVTGGKQEGDRCTEAESSANYLHDQDVPDGDILREVQGRNSWESLAATASILRDEGLTAAVLVTDGYHALRVQAIAEQLGIDASVSPSHEGGSLPALIKETGAVAIGRLVGFDRLVDIDGQIEEQLDERITSETSETSEPDVRSDESGG